MTSPPLSEGDRACALARYLAGDAESPRRGSFPFAAAALLLTARYGPRVPNMRTATALGEDPRLTGLYRSLRLALDEYAEAVARDGDRSEAEHRLALQCSTAFDLCRQYIRDTDFIDLDLDYASDIQDLNGHFSLLAGVLALGLWEVGYEPAREYVRSSLSGLLSGPAGHRYIAVVLGLQEDTEPLSWRSGQGALGTLRLALVRGRALLDGADRRAAPTALSRRPQPVASEPPPAPIPDGPGLLVLASVDHLPGGARDGAERPGGLTGSTPRSEWAPYAGRRWPLAPVPNLAAVREILVAEFPHAADIIDPILRDLAGRAHVLVRPLLLVGAPGCGKTRLARRIGEVLGLGVQVHPCGGASDASILSTSRMWSTGRASTMLQLLKRLQAASAMLVLDELDKVGESKHNGNLLDGILPLLTTDAARFFDNYLECPVDLSGMSYVATANDLTGLRRTHQALLDRFRIYRMPDPRREDLPVLARGVLAEIRAERGLDEAWLPPLSGEELGLVEAHWAGGSVRGIRRLVEAVLAGREALATRM